MSARRRTSRRKTGVVGQAHASDGDLAVHGTDPARVRPGSDDPGFSDAFWEGQRPPHW